ncbi:hypothetical protein SKAU_G00201670 [Synaphobranchus kaupii]|uniref:Uncharacterized protein n=1 Tax=Synaphobranchus kaupii TaxID=118154 RepID=A0A9Q1FG33_SYNKA|nr:hypothetical protein SKAU_G00201670 [Synaphobranchus kaupii]
MPGCQLLQQHVRPNAAVRRGLHHHHECGHAVQHAGPLHPGEDLPPFPPEDQSLLLALRQRPCDDQLPGTPHQWLPGVVRLQRRRGLEGPGGPPCPVRLLRGLHGVLRPQPPAPGERHGGGALLRRHPAPLPLGRAHLPPHQEAGGPRVAPRRRHRPAAHPHPPVLPHAGLTELVLLPPGCGAALAGRSPPPGLLQRGPALALRLHPVQRGDRGHAAALQAPLQEALQAHLPAPGDDLSTPGHNAGVLHLLGPIPGHGHHPDHSGPGPQELRDDAGGGAHGHLEPDSGPVGLHSPEEGGLEEALPGHPRVLRTGVPSQVELQHPEGVHAPQQLRPQRGLLWTPGGGRPAYDSYQARAVHLSLGRAKIQPQACLQSKRRPVTESAKLNIERGKEEDGKRSLILFTLILHCDVHLMECEIFHGNAAGMLCGGYYTD